MDSPDHSHRATETGHHAPQSMLSKWNQFMLSIQDEATCPKFPHRQISKLLQASFSSSNSNLVTLKSLLKILPEVVSRYQRDYSYYREPLILLYIIVNKKNCTSRSVFTTAVRILQSLYRYRLMLICSSSKGQPLITQVYEYLKQWLLEFIPKLLQYQQGLLVELFTKINNSQDMVLQKDDELIVIFDVLLVRVVVNNLEVENIGEFGEFLREICSSEKYQLISRYIGERGRWSNGESVLDFQDLVPIRKNEDNCQVYDAIITEARQDNSTTSSDHKNKGTILVLTKVPHMQPIQNWVTDSFRKNMKPQIIDVSAKRIHRMKPLDLYRLLCMLEIFGSSPNIQYLDQYLPDQKFLDFFCNFLQGSSLGPQKYCYGNRTMKEVVQNIGKMVEEYSAVDKRILCGQLQSLLLQQKQANPTI